MLKFDFTNLWSWADLGSSQSLWPPPSQHTPCLCSSWSAPLPAPPWLLAQHPPGHHSKQGCDEQCYRAAATGEHHAMASVSLTIIFLATIWGGSTQAVPGRSIWSCQCPGIFIPGPSFTCSKHGPVAHAGGLCSAKGGRWGWEEIR